MTRKLSCFASFLLLLYSADIQQAAADEMSGLFTKNDEENSIFIFTKTDGQKILFNYSADLVVLRKGVRTKIEFVPKQWPATVVYTKDGETQTASKVHDNTIRKEKIQGSLGDIDGYIRISQRVKCVWCRRA